MTSLNITFPSILHGGDYNPEQWPEDVWDDDVKLMLQANVNVATLPVFGWVALQPNEETFTFDWLDRIVEKLTAAGIQICFATATASVPAWIDRKYPDVLRVDNTGRRMKHGNRHTFCPTSPNFQRLSQALVKNLVDRYASNPAIVVWHIGNEYATTCYCELCSMAFREWLKVRYGTLAEVNARWNTAFWGHTYTEWAEIEAPSHIAERSIQALLIDYDRFQSQALLNLYIAERDIIRKASSTIPITTNLMGPCKPTDYHRWAKEMDIISWDSYPPRGAKPDEIAFNHSLMRGLKQGQPWMLMEQTPSQQNWQQYNALKRPGVMRLWSYQALAHGADAIMYFQWRRSRGCCEKFHGAVVEHAGRTDARVFQEVATLGRELRALGTSTLNGVVQSEAAILFDWENWWAIEYSSGPTVDLKYVPQVQRIYAALHNLGVTADVVSPSADLSKYKVVVAPVLYMVKEGVAENIEQYVSGGGTFVTTYFSGIADATDLVYLGGYPGPLRQLLGIWVEETDVLSPNESNAVVFSDSSLCASSTSKVGMLCDRIHSEGAEVAAVYAEDFYAGEPAITVNNYGGGHAWYLGTQLDDVGLLRFMKELIDTAGIVPWLGTAQMRGIETTVRTNPQGDSLRYILNHNTERMSFSLPDGNYRELITGETVSGNVTIPKHGVMILQDLK